MENTFKKLTYRTTRRIERVTFGCRWMQHKGLRPFDWVILGIDRRNVMSKTKGGCEQRNYVYRISFFGFYVNIWKISMMVPKKLF